MSVPPVFLSLRARVVTVLCVASALVLSGCSARAGTDGGLVDPLRTGPVSSITADEGHQGTIDHAKALMDSFGFGDLAWRLSGSPDTLGGCGTDGQYAWSLHLGLIDSGASLDADGVQEFLGKADTYFTSVGLTSTTSKWVDGYRRTAVTSDGYTLTVSASTTQAEEINVSSPCMAIDYQVADYKWTSLLFAQDPVVDYGTKQPYPMWATARSWASLKAWVNPAFPPTDPSSSPEAYHPYYLESSSAAG